jgi:hypothetical protein
MIERRLSMTDEPKPPSAIPFPVQHPADTPRSVSDDDGMGDLPASVDDIFATLDSMDRSIRKLARELNCLGFFDDDDDGPRAA